MADTMELTVGQALVRFLAAQEVERDGVRTPFFAGCFGILGHGNAAGLGQAFQQHGDLLRSIRGATSRQWSLAVGYARQRNRLGTYVCTTSVGPGATNMITGAALATINRLPVLLLPSDTFAGRVPHPVLQQLEVTHDATMSVNDRPVRQRISSAGVSPSTWRLGRRRSGRRRRLDAPAQRSGIPERVVERHPNFARWNGAVELFAVYKHCGRRVDADAFGLIHGGPNPFVVLLLEASLKLIGIEVMPLSVDDGQSVQFGIFRVVPLHVFMKARCCASNRHSPNKHRWTAMPNSWHRWRHEPTRGEFLQVDSLCR